MSDLYFIEANYFGHRTHSPTRYYPERDRADAGRAATITAVRCGEITHVNRVLAVDLENGTARDATREIAQAILDTLDEPPSRDLQNFLEDVLGVRTMADVLRDMEAAA